MKPHHTAILIAYAGGMCCSVGLLAVQDVVKAESDMPMMNTSNHTMMGGKSESTAGSAAKGKSGMAMSSDPAHMRAMMKSMMSDLGPADANYDKRFIDMMIPHHEGAVDMAKDALQKAHHPELKQLAKNIIDSQSKEIEQMQRWRREWYGG